jgi:hypothetical protein
MSKTIRLSQISWRRVVMILFCVLSLLAVFPYKAFAHPLGNFSVNRYSHLQLESERVELLYLVDMARQSLQPTWWGRTVYAADSLAWALYHNGRADEARALVKKPCGWGRRMCASCIMRYDCSGAR